MQLLLRLVRVAREVLGAGELTDEVADDFHDGHSHGIGLWRSARYVVSAP